MENSTISCRTSAVNGGYSFPVPDVPFPLVQDKDCEKGWYTANGEFLSDGHLRANQTMHELVVDVNPENITLSKCTELLYRVDCHGSNQKFQHIYKVINDTAIPISDDPSTSSTTIIIIIIAVILFILIPVLIFLGYKKRRWLVGVWERVVCGCHQQTDGNNRINSGGGHAHQNGNAVEIPMLEDTPGKGDGTPAPMDHSQHIVDHADMNMNSCMKNGVTNGEAQPLRDIITDDDNPEES